MAIYLVILNGKHHSRKFPPRKTSGIFNILSKSSYRLSESCFHNINRGLYALLKFFFDFCLVIIVPEWIGNSSITHQTKVCPLHHLEKIKGKCLFEWKLMVFSKLIHLITNHIVTVSVSWTVKRLPWRTAKSRAHNGNLSSFLIINRSPYRQQIWLFFIIIISAGTAFY